MQLTTTYLDSCSTPSSTMTSNINYKDTLFEQANITLICGKPSFKTLHKLWNEIKSNANSVYSNLVGGAYGHLGLVITDTQYRLVSPTPFVYPTQPGPLIITGGTNTHANSNMWIAHTAEVRLFREVTRVEQDLVQQIMRTVEEAYLADTRNKTTNSINDTVAGVLTHLQDNYGQLMLHELLKREDIVKKAIYNPRNPIATVFSAFKEILEFSEITGTSYTQIWSVNIA